MTVLILAIYQPILRGQEKKTMVNNWKFYVILGLDYYLLYSNICELFLFGFQENKFWLKSLRTWVSHPLWIIWHDLVFGQIRASICTAAISEVIWWRKGRYSAYTMARAMSAKSHCWPHTFTGTIFIRESLGVFGFVLVWFLMHLT